MKFFLLGLTVVFSGCLIFSEVWAVDPLHEDTLWNVLREKEILSKEDWVRIEADREKKAKELHDRMDQEFPISVGYGRSGFELKSKDGKFATQMQWRFQGRFTYPTNGDPISREDFDSTQSTLELRRVRMKIGGHGYQPWMKYYFELDLQSTSNSGGSAGSTRLIDWRISLEKWKWLSLQVGQWKVDYNRERRDSSGNQQFVERSIVNEIFTIDRQMGAMLYGHVAPGTPFDSRYYAGVFTGSGRGEANDDGNMMYFGRYQWNFLGRDLKWTQSDVEYHEQPTGSVAFGAYTNIGKCTRWSSSGCGTLPEDNSAGVPYTSDSSAKAGQYRVQGMMEEFAFKWRGLSIQHEYHWKEVKDNKYAEGAPGYKTNMMGSYSQIGYFPHYLIPAVPKPLEVAFRYAFVDPNISAPNDRRQEYTTAINWFFAGHKNKLTLDGSWLTLAQPAGQNQHEQRIRLQWDVSF
ncbi:MAG: OprO/OprP family phosphate-selective porin [Nitrospirota bacterium]|nr:OprO/OprP family phosphate-selective porin [Nitrospirota bacterium]